MSTSSSSSSSSGSATFSSLAGAAPAEAWAGAPAERLPTLLMPAAITYYVCYGRFPYFVQGFALEGLAQLVEFVRVDFAAHRLEHLFDGIGGDLLSGKSDHGVGSNVFHGISLIFYYLRSESCILNYTCTSLIIARVHQMPPMPVHDHWQFHCRWGAPR